MRVDPTAAAGFAAAAEVYERARPTYPPDAIACIGERTGLGPRSTVVDLDERKPCSIAEAFKERIREFEGSDLEV